MRIEHFALNVADPVNMAGWYVEYLGFQVVSHKLVPPFTHFLEGSGGAVLLEIYNNPPDQVPAYASHDPLIVHLAFVSEDPARDSQRLLEAGAQWVSEQKFEDGSHLVMMRDPWGLALQLCKMGTSLLRN